MEMLKGSGIFQIEVVKFNFERGSWPCRCRIEGGAVFPKETMGVGSESIVELLDDAILRDNIESISQQWQRTVCHTQSRIQWQTTRLRIFAPAAMNGRGPNSL